MCTLPNNALSTCRVFVVETPSRNGLSGPSCIRWGIVFVCTTGTYRVNRTSYFRDDEKLFSSTGASGICTVVATVESSLEPIQTSGRKNGKLRWNAIAEIVATFERTAGMSSPFGNAGRVTRKSDSFQDCSNSLTNRPEGLLHLLFHRDIGVVLHHLRSLWIELFYDFVTVAEPSREVDTATPVAAKWE